MAFDFSTLITDRAPADLEALRGLLATPMADWTAEQLAQFNQAASKGAYNYTDLNRVTACMDYLNERLTAAGYVTGYHPIIVHPATPPEPVGPLPEGYTQVEYIESTGTQYIDTGVIPTPETRIDLTFSFFGSAGTNICGCRNSSSDAQNRYGFITFGSTSLFGAFYGTQSVNGPSVNKTQHVFSLGPDGFVADKITTPVQAISFGINYPITLFAFSDGVNGINETAQRIYTCKLSQGDSVLREFLPCENPNGDPGLYDFVSDQFYANSGTGAFIAGPEVPPPEPEPTLDPYTWYESDVPTVSLMDEYLSNVSALRAVLNLPETTPEVPADMDRLTQSEANDIEDILGIIHTYLLALQSILRRCGAQICGGPELYFVN